MLRGRVVKLGDRPAEQVKAPPEAQWVLNGDRGLTYSQAVPDGSTVVAGQWWPADYAGEPLVSFEAETAKGLHLEGRRHRHRQRARPQRHGAHRQPARGEMGKPCPQLRHGVLAQHAGRRPAQPAGDDHAAEEASPWPSRPSSPSRSAAPFRPSTAIRVKDAIDAFNVIFGRVMMAVRAAGSVTLLAGAFVLAGALATAQRRRIQQAVILKTLGATSRRILLSHLAEYAVLALLTAFISLLIGSLAAWIVLNRVMDVDFAFSAWAAAEAMLAAVGLVALFGGFGTWRVLRARPVPYLRSE